MTVAAALNQIKELLAGSVTRGLCRNVDPENAVTSSAIPVAGRIYWSRLKEGGKISTVRYAVTTASGNLCVAYAKNVGSGLAAAPGSVVASTGSFACGGSGTTNVTGGANGDHEQALSGTVTLKAGDWVGIAADTTAAVLRCTTGSGAIDSVLMASSAYRETIASGSPVIPTSRAALTPALGKDWLLIGV